MKLSWGVIASSLYCTAAAARDAHVYLFDNAPRTSSQASSTVDPETARLILAQRLGLSRFHSIKNPTDETLKQLNAFGGKSQKLFGAEDPAKSKAHVLVWIEGVEDAKGMHAKRVWMRIGSQSWQLSLKTPNHGRRASPWRTPLSQRTTRA